MLTRARSEVILTRQVRPTSELLIDASQADFSSRPAKGCGYSIARGRLVMAGTWRRHMSK
jgi:hypothetical protein